MKYWLMKTEPAVFSIDDLQRRPRQIEHWDGVRNYQVRNFIRDEMRCGDLAFFYHSSCQMPGIVGIVSIVKEAYPDFTAFDPQHHHYDPRSTPDHPRWYMVDIRFQEKFPKLVSLAMLRQQSDLSEMQVLRKGNRLSITPVTPAEWQTVLRLAHSTMS